jgi:ABC-type transport system involved in multi-copper enzyme maturation permease subunit
MFYNIFLLELKKSLKSPAFYIFLSIFFGTILTFTLITDPYNYFLGIAHGKEWHNAPIIIAQILTRMSVFGLLFTMVLIGRAVAKDFENNIHELIFSRPVSKIQYLGGRFAGGFVANLLIFTGIILGFEIGIAFLEDKYSGPYQFGSYLLPLIFTVIPNLLLMGIIMFALATLTRKMTATYLAGVAFLAVYAIIGVMLHRMDNETMKVLLDPFGITALTVYSQYWTVADMNNLLMPFNTTFLINRIIWLSVSITILWYTYQKFEFVAFLEKKKKRLAIISEKTELIDYNLKPPVISLESNKFFTFSQCVTISWRDFKKIVLHPAFLILTALALTEIVANFGGGLGNQTGHIYPFTSWFLRQTMHIWIYMLPMTIFFGGMLIWKEKDYRTDEIINTLPIPNWFNYTNKLMTLTGIYILYLGLTIIAGVVAQVFIHDFTDIELGLYFKQLFGVDFFIFLHIAIVVLFIQNLSPNKYIGFFLSALFFIADLIIFGAFGFDNYLFRYGRVPDFIYSNLNGFGHYGQSILWYTIYWLFFGAIIAWMTILLWRRSNENSIRIRLKYLISNITKNQVSGISILLIMFVITGLFIGYNKYVLNPYFSEYDGREMSANYEKKFSKYMHAFQPTIIDINLRVDLFPEERTANIEGEYVLYNCHNKSIKEVYVNLNDWNLSNLNPLEFDRHFTKKQHADEYGFRIFELDQPLQPGDTLTMSFKYDIIANGFSENQPKNEIVENGTCLVLSSFISRNFPVIGYNVNNELLRDKYRKEFDLPDKADAPKISEANRNVAIFDVSRPNYEGIISTSSGQTVISGGRLINQWQEDNRNYFHYKTDTIIENEIAILSGRYDVVREQYKNVNVEVYYHPKHNYNITSILDGLKDSYDYGNKYFSEYPYKDLRIVEIPDYMTEGAARHFPTTFIWIESEGFITRYEEGDIDIVYGIAAHENAHHWWGGIVTPAFAEGAFMLTETMAQYVMATLTDKKFGKKIGRDYRKREMVSYLRRRKHDTEGEKSLLESSVRQSYLGYKKSTVAMYALQDYIGEDSVGNALGRIVEKYGFRLDTFALASDLIDEFYKVTPDSLKYFVDDLFLNITLYENKINGASYRKTKDDQHIVDLDVETIKYYADSIGNQTEAALHDYIYVALMDEAGEAYYYEKHLFTENKTTIQVVTDQIPVKAGIDPYLVLIDREMDDNICEVKEANNSIVSFLLDLPFNSALQHSVSD